LQWRWTTRCAAGEKASGSRRPCQSPWCLEKRYGHLIFSCHYASPSRPSRTDHRPLLSIYEPVWYSFMSSFTSSFTTSIAKWPAFCPALWLASLKTLSHRVKHTVKLQKHSSPLLMKLFSKKQLYWWSWTVPNRAYVSPISLLFSYPICSSFWSLLSGFKEGCVVFGGENELEINMEES
jgi:hypothetical protein